MAEQQGIKKFKDFTVPSYRDAVNEHDTDESVYKTVKSIALRSKELKSNFATIFSSLASSTSWQIYPILDVGRIEINQGTGVNRRIGNTIRLQGLELVFRAVASGINTRPVTRFFVGITPKLIDPGGGVAGVNAYLQGKFFNTNSIDSTRNITYIDECKIIYEFYTVNNFNSSSSYGDVGLNIAKHIYVPLQDTAITFLGSQFSVIENMQIVFGVCTDVGAGVLHTCNAALYYTD